MTAKFRVAFVVLVCLFVVPVSWACRVDDPVFTTNYRWNDLEGNLADYARIHMDAESASCALKADYALTDKVRNTLDANPSEFQGWLRGAHVSLIYAAAQRIGANGFATKELDAQLRRLEPVYGFVKDAGCNNIDGTNNCLDDYSQAAVGYAWIAAYNYRRGDSDANVTPYRKLAIDQINNFFNNVCIHSATGNPTQLCNGSVNGLLFSNDETISFNHGQQMPSYGFGLMTSIASAVMGLKASGYAYSFNYPDQWTIAKALMKEMQAHVDSSNAFKNDCYAISRDGAGVYSFDPSRPCGGPDGYKPGMYALFTFYNQQFNGIPQYNEPGVYQSNYFNSSLFDTSSTSMQFFGMARYVVYGKHGYSWWVTTPEWMPRDLYNPKGYLEAISSTGLAQGWTCDQDAPTKSNVVDLYATNTKVTNIVRADSGSEAAIASECNGGNYHRFWIQLPSWTKGQTITAYGLDYTWFGFTQLPCLQPGGCKW